MTFEGWLVFAAFWVVFVTSPGPNAVNCIQNGMTFGFRRALWGVLAILTQATAFLLLSAAGVTALLAAAPATLLWLRLAGAAMLVWLGIRAWKRAREPLELSAARGSIYGRALLIATFNAKSLAGYLAAFTQFVQPEVPIAEQMRLVLPTALAITAASYIGYTALGAGLGRVALGAVGNLLLRRFMALCLVAYGVALGLWQPAARV